MLISNNTNIVDSSKIPLDQIPLDELSHILLKFFSEELNKQNKESLHAPALICLAGAAENSQYFDILAEALQLLENQGLVRNTFDASSHYIYKITRKGIKALKETKNDNQ
ncbi:MAG: hypothetical protein OXI43_13490 [Candidatus Poribacteria bacterium]|nr:hypothetical protein [Candidatus Poribacteria bacterium]